MGHDPTAQSDFLRNRPGTLLSPMIDFARTPPRSLCLLRLSAIGDITHTLPVLRTVQKHWPQTSLTWVIGKTEYELVREIEGVEFVVFDKTRSLASLFAVRRRLSSRRFDLMFHMQPSLRGNLVAACIGASRKLGFDRNRSHDLHELFIDEAVSGEQHREHVLEGLLRFPRHYKLEPVLEWGLPVSPNAVESVQAMLGTEGAYVAINPCAVAKNRNWRNWTIDGYVAVAQHILDRHGLGVVLTGGRSPIEQTFAAAIAGRCSGVTNLVGETSIAELIAVLSRARLVISPDTGPAHIASALNRPVVGLYAATNPFRAGPYNCMDSVVNRYPEALRRWYGVAVEEAPWGKRIRNDDAMALITAQDVIEAVERKLG